MNLIRACLIAIGMFLIIIALACMGLDMTASLEAHGLLSATTMADLFSNLSPDRLCPGHGPVCTRGITSLRQFYIWVIPGISGVILLWLSTLGRPK